MDTLSLTKEAKIYNGEKTISLTSGAGKTGQQPEKNETRIYSNTISSVQFSRSVVSNSFRLHESQHAKPPCPSPSPGVHSDFIESVMPSSHLILCLPFSSCPLSLPASQSFPMSQLFIWGGQSTGVSALASFLPKNTQGWSPSEWTGWISLWSKGLSRVFSNATIQKRQCLIPSRKNVNPHTKGLCTSVPVT